MKSANLPFERGQTASTGLASVDTTVLDNLEGREYIVEDHDPATAIPRTGSYVKLRLVRNKSGQALLPKRLVKLDTGGTNAYAANVLGYGRLTAQEGCFPADEYLPSTGVADGDLFYIVTEGPALCLTDLAAGAGNLIAVGECVVALTAVTTGATTAGRVAVQDLTGATAILGAQLQNRVGRALTAKTTNNTNADILVHVGKF